MLPSKAELWMHTRDNIIDVRQRNIDVSANAREALRPMPWLARLLEGPSPPQPRLDRGSRAQRGRSEAAISFGQIHKQSGQPRENRKVVPSVGVVENADIAKGYEVSDDTYLPP